METVHSHPLVVRLYTYVVMDILSVFKQTGYTLVTYVCNWHYLKL
jgi:hypothetical protein